MKPNRYVIAGIFAASLTAFSVGAAYASPGEGYAPRPMTQGGHCMQQMHNMRGNAMGIMPPEFRHMHLTEVQRNQIFDIKYKSMPILRQHYQQLRQTRKELRLASTAAPYDAAKVHSLANRMGRLEAMIAVRRADDKHKIFAVLTPAQQHQSKQMHDWRSSQHQRPAMGL